MAIDRTRTAGKHVPLVTFGHMHHKLRHTKKELRKSLSVSAEGTVYLKCRQRTAHCGERMLETAEFLDRPAENGTVSEVSLVWLGEDFAWL